VSEYYPVEKVTELDGGRLRIRMRYADLSWMVRLLLGLGGDVSVEEPEELAAGLRDRARRALARAGQLSVTP
jgi:proteasome accessory factor C